MKENFKKDIYKYWARMAVVFDILINISYVICITLSDIEDKIWVAVAMVVINLALMALAIYCVNHKKEDDNAKIEEMAYRDFETGMYNMNYLTDNYKRIVKRIGSGKCAYINIDIDNFKFVNNVMGYETGNAILTTIAKVMQDSVKEKELAIRVGGDVFGMIMEESQPNKISERIEKIFDEVKTTIFNDYTERANISFSCGVYIIDNVEENVKYTSDKAGIARKSVKNSYTKNIAFFDEQMQQDLKNRAGIEEDMKKALENEDFLIYLQPKVNMITGKLYGAEALVRWQHKTKGLLSPGNFIPIFEDNGFILDLDYYMFELVCKLKRRWKDEGKRYPIISVNMSRLHIYDKNFIYNLLDIAKKYEIPANELELEVTENAFFEDSQMLLAFTDDLKRAGFKVSIDDFGSGFSSLNMLKDVNADVLKIDRAFLLSMDKNDGKGKKILKNVISMARDLKIDIVTEGVETIGQIELLTNYGCEIAQGFYYAKPMTVEEYELFATVHGEFLETACLYRFDGTLVDEYDGEDAKLIGTGFKFVDGFIEGKKALFMPGGAVSENYIQIPTKCLKEESFTISFWMNTGEVFSQWSSLVYAEYETGFFSYMPVAWNGSMSFRIMDRTYTEGWHDNHYPAIIKKNQWYNIVLTYNAKLEVSRIYVNGEAVGYRGHVPPLRGVRSLYIGGDIYQPSMSCTISDLMISDQVKTNSEIREAYRDMVNNM